MMAFQIMDIADLPMAYGNLNFLKIYYENSIRLLASCKLELKNDSIIKSGNTTMNVKILENKNEV